MLNIEIDKKLAQQQVDQLGASIVALGDKAAQASAAVGKKLDFGATARREISGLRSEFKALHSVMSGFSSAVASSVSVIDKQAAAQASMRSIAEQAGKALVDQTAAMRNQTAAIKAALVESKKMGVEQEQQNQRNASATKIINMVQTAHQKHGKQMAEIRKLLDQSKISQDQYNRAVEMFRKTLSNTGTEAEVYLSKLKLTNKEFQKSETELARMRSGWSTLSESQRKATETQIALSQAMRNTSNLFKESLSPLQQYQRQLEQLNLLRNSVGSDKRRIISEREYQIALKNAEQQLESVMRAEQKRYTIKPKRSTADNEDAALQRHIQALKAQNAVLGKTEVELIRSSEAFKRLGAAEQQTALAAVRLKTDLQSVSQVVGLQIKPLDQYRERLEAASRARAAFANSGGRQGIDQTTFIHSLRGAKKELDANVKASIQASHGLSLLSKNFGLGAQAAAGFRAAMIGANLSFGIFTGSTIVIATGVFAFAKALNTTVRAGANFEQAFERAAIMLKSLEEVNGSAAVSINRTDMAIRSLILSLAETTQFNPQEVAEATGVLAMSGMTAFETFNSLGSVLDLAAVGMIGVSEAADIATGILASFGLSANQFESAVDIIAATANKSKASVQDLGSSMRYIGPIAAQAGLQFYETAAALGVLAESNIRGSRAGTAFRRIVTNIVAPTKQGAAAFKAMGIDIKALTKNGVDLVEIFGLLRDKGAGIEELKKIFGQYALAAGGALTLSVDKLEEFTDQLQVVPGYAAKIRTALRDNVVLAFEELQSVIATVSTLGFDLFGDDLKAQLDSFSNYIRANSGEIASVIGTTAKAIVTSVTLIADNLRLLLGLLGAFLSYKILGAVFGTIAAGITRATVAGKMFAAQQGMINVASAQYVRMSPAFIAATQSKARAFSTLAVQQTKAVGAMTTFSRASSVMAGAGARLMGVLGGWPGVIIAIASIALPMLANSMTTASDAVYNFTGAIEEYSAFSSQIPEMNDRVFQKFALNIKQDLEESNRQLSDLKAKLTEIAKAKADLSSGEGRPGGLSRILAFASPTTLGQSYIEEFNWVKEKTQLTSQLTEVTRNLARAELVNQEAREGSLAADINSLVIIQEKIDVQKIVNDQLDQGSILTNILSGEQTNYVEKLTTTSQTLQGLTGVFSRLFDVMAGTMSGEALSTNPLIASLTSALGPLQEGFNKIKEMVEKARAQRVAAGAPPKDTSGVDDFDGDTAEKIKETTNALTKYFSEYEKGTASVAGLKRELAELDEWQAKIKAGSAEAAIAMKEQGYSAAEAEKALKWKKDDLILDYLSQTLGELDPRFKDLKKSLMDTRTGQLDMADATREVHKALVIAGVSASESERIMSEYGGGLNAVATGAAQAQVELTKLVEEAAKIRAELSGPSTFDGEIERFVKLLGEGQRELVTSTLATVRGNTLFAASMKKVATESEKLSEAQKILKLMVDAGAISASDSTKIFKEYSEALPTGALEKQNEELRQRIQLTRLNGEEQYIWNLAIQEFGADLKGLTPKFLEAAKASYRLMEELKQIEEVKNAFRTFGEGIARTFSGLINGTTKSFKDFTTNIKDMFLNLLAELVYAAARNAIVLRITGEGTGNTGGFFSSIAQGFGNLFGARGGSSAAGSAAAPLYGSGQGMMAATSQGGMMNALGSLFGVTGGSAGASGGSGGFGSALSSFTSLFGGGGSTGGGISSMISSGFNSVVGGIGSMFGFGATALNAVGPLASGYAGLSAAAAPGMFSGLVPGAVGYTGAIGSTAAAGAAAGGGMTMAAAIPVIGWIIAGMMANDSFYQQGWRSEGGSLTLPNGDEITGGGSAIGRILDRVIDPLNIFGDRLTSLLSGSALFTRAFGRKAPELRGNTSTFSFGSEGASGSEQYNILERGGWFRSDRRSTVTGDLADSSREYMEEFFRSLEDAVEEASRALGVSSPGMVDSALRIVREFDKKGEVTSTKYLVDILGKTYEEETVELAQMRLAAEGIIGVIDSTFAGVAPEIASAIQDPIMEGLGRINGEGMFDAVNTVAAPQGEASIIAERWRDDAELLMEGAQFLLAATSSIRQGYNLLGDGSTLTELTDLIEGLKRGSETMLEAFSRIVKSTELVEESLGGFGIVGNRTRAEFIEFSSDLVSMMGGVDEAGATLRAFTEAFADLDGVADYRAQQAGDRREFLLGRVGLSADTNRDEFSEAFLAALPTLSASETADWIQAGSAIATVVNALNDMREQLEETSLVDQINQTIESIRLLGASEAELAEARMIGDQILRNALNDMMSGVEDEIAALQGSPYAFKLEAIAAAMNSALSQAEALGAGETELTRIRLRAELQIAEIAKQLSDFMFGIDGQIASFEGRELTHQLGGIARQMTANITQARSLGASEMQLARIRRLAGYQTIAAISEARNALASLVSGFYAVDDQAAYSAAESASQQAQAQFDAANELYEAEMQRYEDAQDAIKRIGEFLRDLNVGALAPGSLSDRLGSARTNFMDMFARAQAGDPEALAGITDSAQTYLELASEFFGSTTDYAAIFNVVTGMLGQLQASLGAIPNPVSPTQPGGSDSSSSSSSSSGETEAQREQRRAQEALEIARRIGDLGLALNVSVYDLMDEFGIKLTDLAAAMGISNVLSESSVVQLQMLSAALGVGMTELIDELGLSRVQYAALFETSTAQLLAGNFIGLTELSESLGISVTEAVTWLGADLASIANLFGVKVETLTTETVAGLVSMAEAMNVNSTELIEALGINMSDLAVAFGVSLSDQNEENFAALQLFATSLGVDIITMAERLGMDFSWVGNELASVITNRLSALPLLPEDITTGIEPYLTAIRDADSSAEVRDAVGDLSGWVETLPEAQAAILRPLLTSLGLSLGSTVIPDAMEISNAISRNIQAAVEGSKAALDSIHEVVSNELVSIAANTYSAVNLLADILANSPQTTGIAGGASYFIPSPEDGAILNMLKVGSEGEYLVPTNSAGSGSSESVLLAEAQARAEAEAEMQQEVIEKLSEISEKLDTINETTGKGVSMTVEKQQEANDSLQSIQKSSRRQEIKKSSGK